MASDGNVDLEIHSSKKRNNPSIRLWSWKAKLLIGFSAIFAALFLVVLFTLEFRKATKIVRAVKTKRFVKMNGSLGKSENAETMQNDIKIIPEERLGNFDRRANRHPNHRYLEPKGDNYTETMKDLFNKIEFSARPFDMKAEEYLSTIRNVISKKKRKGKKTRSEFQNLKSSGGTMRFKGIFGYASSDRNLIKNPGPANFYYPREINNLVQNNSSGGVEKNKALKKKKPFKSHGAPFQVAVKDDPRLNMYQSTSSQPKQFWFKERFRKPLTILLDVYPMADNDNYFNKERPKLSNVIKPLGDIHSTEKFPFPQESRNGIIMKLNLYAKDKELSGSQNSIGEAEDVIHLNDGERVEEKSFGWFSTKKEKEQETKRCSLMALKPRGKHVTAKWKNENGEWIHAKHVSVKYLK